jgi:hypothetical protein
MEAVQFVRTLIVEDESDDDASTDLSDQSGDAGEDPVMEIDDEYPALDWKQLPSVNDSPFFLNGGRNYVDIPKDGDTIRPEYFYSTESVDYIRMETKWMDSPLNTMAVLSAPNGADQNGFLPFVFYPSKHSYVSTRPMMIMMMLTISLYL